MRFLILGAGGVGGYFGGRLAQAGEDVTFVARGEHLTAIRAGGLRVDSVKGDFTVRPARVVEHASEVAETDCVVIATKTWQLPEAAESIRHLRNAAVLPLQNGVEAPWQLAETLGKENVLAGVAKIFSYIEGPGHILHLGGAASITFGELDNRSSERAGRILETLTRAGIAADIAGDIHQAMWSKFLFVTPLGAVGAVTRSPIGVIRSLPETRAMLEEAMREICLTAIVKQVILPADIIERTMEFVDSQPAQGTSSLQRDIMAGRPSELDAWTGAVLRIAAQRQGVHTPVIRFLHTALLPMELAARGR